MDQTCLDQLQSRGFVVLRGVVPKDACARARALIDDTFGPKGQSAEAHIHSRGWQLSHYTKSRAKAAAFATFSGLFEVVGAMLMQLFFDDITPYVMEWMLALVAGVMVALTLIELLPSTLEMVAPKQMALSFSLGMLFMFCSKEVSRTILSAIFGSN